MATTWDWGIKCRSCSTFFHLVVEKELEFSELFCVECKSADLSLESYEEVTESVEVNQAIYNLAEKVAEIDQRLRALEQAYDDDPEAAPDAPLDH